MEGSQNTNDEGERKGKSKEERALETQNAKDRNHFIIQCYVETHNALLAVKNPKHTIKDVWNHVHDALKKLVHFYYILGILITWSVYLL